MSRMLFTPLGARRLLMLVALLLLLVLPTVVLAQEGDPAQPPELGFLEGLMDWLEDATYLLYAAPVVVGLTALIKRLPFFNPTVDPRIIALVCQVVIWLLHVVALRAGFSADDLARGAAGIDSILQGLSYIVLGSFGTQVIYDKMSEAGVPILGEPRRSDNPLLTELHTPRG